MGNLFFRRAKSFARPAILPLQNHSGEPSCTRNGTTLSWQILLEKITGKSLGTNIKELLLSPLKMHRTTLGDPEGRNVAVPYAVDDTGKPCRVWYPEVGEGHGLAGGGGAKSTIKDLLMLYQSFLLAFEHQTRTGSDSTPGSPFKQLRTILAPHIGVGKSPIDRMAYCLGLYRTRLPRNLGFASMNNMLIGTDKLISTGAESPGVHIYHHTANLSGFFSSVFLVPSTQSAIVVMTNSFPLLDPTDFVGQLLVSVLLGEKPGPNILQLCKATRSASRSSYSPLIAQLANHKATKPPQFPYPAYEGEYINAAGNFVLSVTANPSGLLLNVQPPSRTYYDLLPYDGNTFFWPANREDEICKKGMWPFLSAGFHKIRFETDKDGVIVDRLVWAHDVSAKPEVFRKKLGGQKRGRGKL
ncbi:hypothetical protein MMC18_001169 [Xylographa bjoerkii]|nr:hypothetical protein [Xylographa bjoerkii]